MLNYLATKKINKKIVRVLKNDSAFLYFTLEASEGMAFYSTLEESNYSPYRDIEINCTLEFSNSIDKLLKKLEDLFPIQYLKDEIIDDTDTELDKKFNLKSTIYGPVRSWRFGMSLGIDLLFETSICSFNCSYCQLGSIQNVTNEIKNYVSTDKVINDFKEFLKKNINFDVITFSGSGEPTLAKNLGEVISIIKRLAPEKKIIVLTNSTTLNSDIVINNLQLVDTVIAKIDAADEQTFKKINRPYEGITLKSTIEGILNLKSMFKGTIDIQTMFMPMNMDQIEKLSQIYKLVNPQIVQLNTPKRPYPTEWHRENRGNHEQIFNYPVRNLSTVTIEDAKIIEEILKKNTGLKIISIYQ